MWITKKMESMLKDIFKIMISAGEKGRNIRIYPEQREFS